MEKRQFLDSAYRDRTPDQTRDFYDRWSQVYDEELTRNDYRQPRRCAEALANLMPDRDARILDAGCGTGLSGMALAQAGYRFVDGCDFSLKMLEKAFARGVYSKTFVCDLNAPPIDAPGGCYAAVAAVGVFSWGHVRPDALDEFLRVLCPGGVIVVGVNERFHAEGRLTAKMALLASQGRIGALTEEHGEHIPGAGLAGWVLTARKTDAAS